MAKAKATAPAAPAVDIMAVEALLDDLDLSAIGEDVIEEPIEEIIGDDLSDDEVRDLELVADRADAYDRMESSTGVDEGIADETPAKKAAGKKAKAEKTAKAAKAPKAEKEKTVRTPRELTSVAAEFFVLETGDAADDANKAAVMATIPSQKKIAEKFENLFTALSVGKLPSVYVVQAFKLLDAKGSLTSANLIADFKTTYSSGTAMSQAGQIMALFDVVKIAKRDKSVLTLNANSSIAAQLRTAIKAAKTVA